MPRFAINPPNSPLTDGGGYVTAPWYRWFSRVQDVLGEDLVAAIAAAPVVTYSATTAFSADRILTAGAGIGLTSAATTLTVALTTTGVAAAAYGNAATVPTFTVDAYGRLTLATDVAIAISASAITSGTLVVARGGTGLSSYTVGDLIYASGATTLSKLADVATGNALISGGVGVAPSWGKVGLTTHISGTLAVGNGGSGATTLTGYLVGNGAAAFTAVATIPASDISSGAALTRVDDTNVTLTLGGTPTTALLAATSLTLGWTGTLSGTRGGTGVNNGSSTITLGGNFVTSGAFALTLTITAATNVTLPTTGTLATLAGSETFTNKTLTSPVISGGTIDNAVIGGTTAVAGTFTTLSGTTSVTTPIVKSATSVDIQTNGTTSAVTVDVNKNVVMKGGSLQTQANGSTAIANALNDDLAITTNSGFMTFTGGGASAQLGGMVAGSDGQRIVIMNNTGSGVPIVGESATSAAANRIFTQGLATAAWNNLGTREFIYSSAQSRWLMLGSTAA